MRVELRDVQVWFGVNVSIIACVVTSTLERSAKKRNGPGEAILMRTIFTRLLASTVALLALLALPPSSSSAPADGACGVWRWNVKTLSDGDASQVSFTPVSRTVSQLRRLREPDELRTGTPRIDPVELTVYRTRVRLLEYKRERDRDFHIVVADPRNRRRTMVTEVVDPTCPGARDSPRLGTLRAVRQEFIGLFGQPTTSFKIVPSQPIAILIGVGFWDSCKGAHIPRGAAPNCIELHPVLDVEPLP